MLILSYTSVKSQDFLNKHEGKLKFSSYNILIENFKLRMQKIVTQIQNFLTKNCWASPNKICP